MIWILVAAGGAVGALSRWLIVAIVPDLRSGFPIAISAVNVLGSFALGFVVGVSRPGATIDSLRPLTVGALGGFTTFSTWMIDVDAADDRRMSLAILAIPTALGIAGAAIGIVIGSRIA